MYLLKLSLKNIKRNIYNYTLYFAAIVFIVMVYSTFDSIQSLNIIPNTQNSDSYVTSGFLVANYVLFFFSILFLWYCNSFFIKKRVKEFALYSVLGVKRSHIGLILTLETLSIAILALILGIFLSSLFLKLFIMILLKLMNFPTSIAKMYISSISISKTLTNYFIIFIIISLRNYLSIRKIKLVNLFRYNNEEDKPPKVSWILSIAFAALTFYGYYIVIKYSKIVSGRILLGLMFITLGTYGLFSHFLVSIIYVSKKYKTHYYKEINMFRVSQLLYKIKKNAKTLATISILITGTILAVGVAYSTYYTNVKDIKDKFPFSFGFVSDYRELDEAINKAIKNHPSNPLDSEVEVYFARVDGEYPKASPLLQGESLMRLSVISQSQYNKLCSAAKIKGEVDMLSEDEAVIIDGFYREDIDPPYLDKQVYIKKLDKSLKVSSYRPYFLINEELIYKLVVVTDKVYDLVQENERELRFKGYRIINEKSSALLSNEALENFNRIVDEKNLKENSKGYLENNLSSFYNVYKRESETSGLFIFVGTFLGLVLLLCTASIIFFKQVSDATEDKASYDILMKLGATNKDIISSIYKQVTFFFLTPLIVGICHTLLIINLMSFFLVNTNVFIPMLVTIIVYSLIYLVYCAITVNSYYKVVKGK